MQLRPQEVVDWGHQRSSIPLIQDVQQFGKSWVDWWGSCQPKWRSVAEWPFPRDDTNGDWDRLNVTGLHGLFPVVMSTSWWAASADLDPHRAAFDTAVADLHWVIGRLLSLNQQTTQREPIVVSVVPVNHFPGHGEREPGKRRIRPSSKACGRD